jgi:opacity protein-like surface antigen
MRITLPAILLTLLAAYAAGAVAQNSPPRGGKWEFTLQPQYTHSMSFDTGHGSGGQVDSALGFGFGVAYNLNNHFQLGGDFFWNQASYVATIADANNPGTTVTAQGTLSTSTIRFSGVWNMLASDFTPFAMVGIGSTYVDTNIPTAPPVNSCWWDPWWGYYCGSYYPTRTAYYVSYSGGLGLRWDIDRNMFLRAAAIRQWLDASGSLGTVWTDQYRFDIGFKF